MLRKCCKYNTDHDEKLLINDKHSPYGTKSDYQTIANIESIYHEIPFQPSSKIIPLVTNDGKLSKDFHSCLSKIFNDFSYKSTNVSTKNNIPPSLIMTKSNLIQFYHKCYPEFSTNYFCSERADYILSKYGILMKEIKKYLETFLNSKSKMKTKSIKNKKTIVSETEVKIDIKSMNNSSYFITDISHHKIPMVMETDEHLIQQTLKYCSTSNFVCPSSSSPSLSSSTTVSEITYEFIDDELLTEHTVVLFKSNYFLFYKKLAIDKPLMVRLEMFSLGFLNMNGSGVVCCDSKTVNRLAFNVQQLRNRNITQIAQLQTMKNALSVNECMIEIQKFVEEKTEPLDVNADNIFRRKKPMKFGRICHICCPCVVICARCCNC